MSKYKHTREEIALAEREAANQFALLADKAVDPYARGVFHGFVDSIEGYLARLEERR